MLDKAAREKIDYPILAIALFSLLYNAILAFINHNVMAMSTSHVVLCEGAVLVASAIYLLRRGLYEEDAGLFLYLGFALVMALYVMALNRMAFIDQFRNALIIVCLAGLGSWANERTMRLVFGIGCLMVLVFLLCEIVSTEFYVALFHPGAYFENTRGIKQVSFNHTGLFANALGFEGRFSFGLIDHRSSSIFLEQVSLANFCGVAVMYLLSFWERIGRAERLLFLATIVLILLTNDTRTMLIFSFVSIAGYFVFPRIPKTFDLALMPAIILVGFFVHLMKPNETGDNFTGRIGLTINKLLDLDFSAVLGLSVGRIAEFADSGYPYLIYGSTLLGLIAFWLFVCLYPAGASARQRRLCHSLSLFIFLNMMIGGTAIFSMKIAGLLWLLVGYMRFADDPRAGRQDLADVASGGVPA